MIRIYRRTRDAPGESRWIVISRQWIYEYRPDGVDWIHWASDGAHVDEEWFTRERINGYQLVTEYT